MTKISPLFRKYQREILAFANQDWGKDYLSGLGYRLEKSDSVVRVTPNNLIVLKDFRGGKPLLQAVFFSRAPVYRKIAIALDAMSIAESESGFRYSRVKDKSLILAHHLGFISPRSYLPLVLMDTSTFNPVAGSNTPVDGSVKWQVGGGGGVAWGTITSEANGTSASDVETNQGLRIINDSGSNYRGLYRSFLLFDTSSLTAGATISSATFSVFGGLNAGGNALVIRPYSSNPAATNTLATSDFPNVGSTPLSNTTTINGNTWSTIAYNDYPLNASGISNINKTGISKFSVRFDNDATATDPGIAGGNEQDNYLLFADNGSNIPKLVVNFTAGPPLNVDVTGSLVQGVKIV